MYRLTSTCRRVDRIHQLLSIIATRRELFLFALWILTLASTGLVPAQTKSSPDAPASSCKRENALEMIGKQIDSAKLIDDSVKRIAVLLRGADLLWPYQTEKARAAFSEAFALALANFTEKGDQPRLDGLAMLVETPDQRYVVIRAIAKHDAAWARKLTEQMLKQEGQETEAQAPTDSGQDTRTAGKLLDLASSLIPSDINSAINFARISLRYPAAPPLLRFIYKFAEVNQSAADQFYQEALAAYRGRTLSEFLYLSPYPFGNNQAAGDMPINAHYSIPHKFTPNSALQRLFIQALLLRGEQAAAGGQGNETGFNGISDTGQIWLALTRLEPQIQQSVPDLTEAVEQSRRNIFALLSQETQASVSSGISSDSSDQESVRMTLEEEVKRAEKEANADRHDQIIVSAVQRASEKESPENLIKATDQIFDSNIRQQLLDWLYFSLTQSAIKKGQFGEARKFALKVEDLDQRAYLYSEIAKETLSRIETQTQAHEVLDEILATAEKAPNTIVTARTLLTVAYLYAKIDLNRSMAVLGDAIKSINHLESPDFSRQSLTRRIEGKNFARYATFQIPGLTPENAFRELGKVDFDDASYLALNFTDKSLRELTTLSLADTCLQQERPEQKKEKTKKKTGL
jgi:hypothetical protein